MSLRAAFFCVITKRIVVISYRRFEDNPSVPTSGFKNPKESLGSLSFERLRWSRGSVLAFGTQVRGSHPVEAVGFLAHFPSEGK